LTAALIFNNGFRRHDQRRRLRRLGLRFGCNSFSTAHTRLATGRKPPQPGPATDINIVGHGAPERDHRLSHAEPGRPGRPQLNPPEADQWCDPNDLFTRRELLQSEYKPGTANNENHAIREEGLAFIRLAYVTDVNAWFLLGTARP